MCVPACIRLCVYVHACMYVCRLYMYVCLYSYAFSHMYSIHVGLRMRIYRPMSAAYGDQTYMYTCNSLYMYV